MNAWDEREAGPPDPPDMMECPDCKGAGKVKEYEADPDDDCEFCMCLTCDGTGEVPDDYDPTDRDD